MYSILYCTLDDGSIHTVEPLNKDTNRAEGCVPISVVTKTVVAIYVCRW